MANSVIADELEDTRPLLSPYPRSPSQPCLRCRLPLLSTLALAGAVLVAVLVAVLFLVWPADPGVRIARVRLDHVHLSTSPAIYLNVSMRVSVKVRNPNYFSLSYDSVDAAIAYRGRELGSAESDGGRVAARGVSYVDAELLLDGFRVIHDIVYLIEDYRRGSIPFETIAEVQGMLRFFFIDIPVQGKFSCSVIVNAQNQTILRQDCYIEVSKLPHLISHFKLFLQLVNPEPLSALPLVIQKEMIQSLSCGSKCCCFLLKTFPAPVRGNDDCNLEYLVFEKPPLAARRALSETFFVICIKLARVQQNHLENNGGICIYIFSGVIGQCTDGMPRWGFSWLFGGLVWLGSDKAASEAGTLDYDKTVRPQVKKILGQRTIQLDRHVEFFVK